jgi:hypothetical protein
MVMQAFLVVELDVDREARVVVEPGREALMMVHEDMHYPLEQPWARPPTEAERAEVMEKIGRGEMRVVKTGGGLTIEDC